MTTRDTTPTDPCGDTDLTPRRPDNRPGLAEIAYRIGRHPDFLARMRAAIPRTEVVDPATGDRHRPLAALTARTTEDPSVALMDAWAASLDVLTFYQERLANEGYLPTATEPLSLLELARTVGYERSPGVAASADLAFTVEDADDPFRVVAVPAGIQVLSVPAESDEVPQTFETVEAITARAEWNAIRARLERAQNLALLDREGDDADGTLYLLDLDNSFAPPDPTADDAGFATIGREATNDFAPADFVPVTPGLDLDQALDALTEDRELNPEIVVELRAVPVEELYLRGVALRISAGTRLLLVGVRTPADGGDRRVRAVPFQVLDATEEPDYGVTRVLLRRTLESATPPTPQVPKLLSLRIAEPVLPIGTVQTTPVAFNTASVGTLIRRSRWSGAALSAFVKTQNWPRIQLMRVLREVDRPSAPLPGEIGPGIHVLRQRVGMFGNGAPDWDVLPKTETPGGAEGPPAGYPEDWEPGAVPRPIWRDSQGEALDGVDAYLEREVPEAVPEGWVLLETDTGRTLGLRIGRAATRSRADFALSGKATGLVLQNPDGSDFDPFQAGAGDPQERDGLDAFTFRNTTAFVASEILTPAGLPIREALAADSTEVTLDSLYLDFEPGRPVSIGGERVDAPGIEQDETQVLADVIHAGGFTKLRLEDGLAYGYTRASVRINGNVARATHGESRVDEVLGDGDSTRPNQAFALAKPPLTFVAADTDSGAATTLTVRVGGVSWREVPSLWDAGPDDAVYMVRIDDDGTTRVVFGDGTRGRRLPTGSQNVTATYRTGMGVEGEVGDGALQLLKKRPLGIRKVVNPSAASGTAPAEDPAELKSRAPESVRTLGRIVSLTDYADFARGFAGIGKARVDTFWRGAERIAFLTVAPVTAGTFPAGAATLTRLVQAVDRFRDAGPTVLVDGHAARLFGLSAKIFVDPAHRAEDVEAAVRAVLEERFGYAARHLGQGVGAAEVIAAIQGVAGVDHLDLDSLFPYREDAAAEDASDDLAAVIAALPARPDPEDPLAPPLPAELLTVLPAAIHLTMETVDDA